MIRTFSKMYEGLPIARHAKIIDFDWPYTGTLKRIRFKARNTSGLIGTWYFNLRNNGVYVLPITPIGMLKFTSIDVDDEKEVNISVVEGTPGSIDVYNNTFGRGSIQPPITVIFDVDDGKNPYTLSSETEVVYSGALVSTEIVFTGIEIGTAYIVGSRVRIVDNDTPNQYLEGEITDIDGQNFTVEIDTVIGSGTSSNWSFTLSGQKGSQGIQGDPGIQGDQGDPGNDGADGLIQSVVAGTGIDVDNTDPANPIVSAENPVESMVFALSDETTNLTTGTGKLTTRMPYAFRCTDVRLHVNTAPVGSTIMVDINKSGSSIFTATGTRPSIDASEKTSTTAATPFDFNGSDPWMDFADDEEVTFDLDQIGSGTAGKGLKVTLVGRRQ